MEIDLSDLTDDNLYAGQNVLLRIKKHILPPRERIIFKLEDNQPISREDVEKYNHSIIDFNTIEGYLQLYYTEREKRHEEKTYALLVAKVSNRDNIK